MSKTFSFQQFLSSYKYQRESFFKIFIYKQKRMDHNLQQPEQQGLIRSTFEETLQTIDDRMIFLRDHQQSLQPELLKYGNEFTIKTISDIASQLGVYYFHQSPVQCSLRDMYTSQFHTTQQYRCVLPPPSEGEESVTEQNKFQPTFQWLSRSIIDSNLISVDQVEAKKPEKGNVPPDWGSTNQLLIYNISKKIHIKSEVLTTEKVLINKFYFVKVKKIKQLYYKGKPSLLIKFSNEYNCSYAYYNLSNYEVMRKQVLGSNSDVYKILSNRIKNIQQQKWVAVLFRKLPSNFTKEFFIDMLRKKGISPIWMQELILIDNFKYTLCKVSFLDDVFELYSRFQSFSALKDVKINLHPKSCKAWKKDNQDYLT